MRSRLRSGSHSVGLVLSLGLNLSLNLGLNLGLSLVSVLGSVSVSMSVSVCVSVLVSKVWPRSTSLVRQGKRWRHAANTVERQVRCHDARRPGRRQDGADAAVRHFRVHRRAEHQLRSVNSTT